VIQPGSFVTACRLLLPIALVATTYLATTQLPASLQEVNDKLGHLLAYLGLALLMDGAFPDRGFGWRKWLPLMLYGIGIELIQSQIPYRQFSLLDLVANGGGLAIYAIVAPFVGRNLLRH
jgi:VanZ family protein